MTMVSLILIPILCGVVLYKIPMKFGKVLLMLVQGYLGIAAVSLFLQARSSGSIYELLGGDNPILYVGLQGDVISLVFVCLTVLLFTLAFIYSMHDKFFDNKFMLLFLVLQGVIMGIFLADDLFNLFILLEVSTVVGTLLIMFKKDVRSVYDGLFYLIMQILSMMFFLFGIAYIYKIFGVLSISEITNLMSVGIPAESLILPFAFLTTGVCLKIGFFPLFSWVSRSYGNPGAPFPVLMILSGLFVKNSLYLFIRLNSIFSPVIDFSQFFLILTILSGVVGVIKALSQKDLKLLLAYSTISQVGLIAIGTFMPNQVSYWGSIYHILNHAILKSLLFLVTGMIVDEYKTSNVHKIRGVFKRMPVVAVVALVAVLGITGAPLFNGSISKYWVMAGSTGSWVEAALWVINTGTILTYIKFSSILLGKSEVKASTDGLKTGVIVFLGLITFLGGIFGPQIVSLLFDVELYISMSSYLLKGIIYVGTVIGGIILYRFVLSKTNILYRLWEGSLTLPRSCFVLLAFFTSLIAYGIWSI